MLLIYWGGGGVIIVTKSEISVITNGITVPSRLLSRSLHEEREVTTYFAFVLFRRSREERVNHAVLSIWTFIMFFLRDAFLLSHGFRSTRQCGVLSEIHLKK